MHLVVLQGDGKILFHSMAAPLFYPREVAILYQVLGSSCCNLFYILDFFVKNKCWNYGVV
jgi:hypothetical protein